MPLFANPQTEEASQHAKPESDTYDIISVLYHALQGAENCQTYLRDAKDGPVRDFFQQALQAQRRLADQGKQVLQQLLQQETGGQSAFGWGQSSSSGQSQSGSQDQSNFETQGSGGGGSSSGSSF